MISVGLKDLIDAAVGDKTVNEISIGSVTVWSSYSLTNISVEYSGGMSYLHPNSSLYYARISGTLTYYNNGQAVVETVYLTPSSSSDSITISGNYIYWNKADYGDVERAANIVTVTGTYTINGKTFTQNVSLSLGANTKSRTLNSRALSIEAEDDNIGCSDTTVLLTPYITNIYDIDYTSGIHDTDTDHVGYMSIYINDVEKGTGISHGVQTTVNLGGNNNHNLTVKDLVCYCKYGSDSSSSITVYQDADYYTTTATTRGYDIEVTNTSYGITAAGGSAEYEVYAYHYSVETDYWHSDGAQKGQSRTVVVDDDWTYAGSGSTGYFSASKSGDTLTVTHDNMALRSSDAIAYRFKNASEPTTAYKDESISVTNSISGYEYDVELEIASTTVSMEAQDIGISKSNLLTYPVYESGSRGTATSQSGSSYLYISGTGFSFTSGRSSIHVTRNTGGDRTGVVSLNWSAHSVSKSITITQSGIETVTVTVKRHVDYSSASSCYFTIDHVLPQDLVINWEDPIETQATYILTGTTITYEDLTGFMGMAETPFVPEYMVEEYEEEKFRRYVFVDGGEV